MTMNFKRKRTVLLQNGDTVRNQVKHLLIILSILLLSSPVIGDNHKGETLYGWITSSSTLEWKGFGDKESHPIYKGDVENGKPSGLGVITFPDGSRFVGEYKDGEKNGQGTFTFSWGGKYEGEYKDGKQNGQGTETYPSGSKYVGEWKDGKRHGQGSRSWSDGLEWVGEWRDNYKWKGIMFDKEGNVSWKIDRDSE